MKLIEDKTEMIRNAYSKAKETWPSSLNNEKEMRIVSLLFGYFFLFLSLFSHSFFLSFYSRVTFQCSLYNNIIRQITYLFVIIMLYIFFPSVLVYVVHCTL